MENFSDVAKAAWTTDDGKTTFCVPMASVIHGFIYNKDAFDKLGLTAPTTEDEFFAVLDKIKADGTYIPLAMGTNDQWEAATMGYQNIGPNYWKGEEGRMALIEGKQKLTDPPMGRALQGAGQVEALSRRRLRGADLSGQPEPVHARPRRDLSGRLVGHRAVQHSRRSSRWAPSRRRCRRPATPATSPTTPTSRIGINAKLEATPRRPRPSCTGSRRRIRRRSTPTRCPASSAVQRRSKLQGPAGAGVRRLARQVQVDDPLTYQILSRGTPNLENETLELSRPTSSTAPMTPEAAAKKLQDGLDSWYKPARSKLHRPGGPAGRSAGLDRFAGALMRIMAGRPRRRHAQAEDIAAAAMTIAATIATSTARQTPIAAGTSSSSWRRRCSSTPLFMILPLLDTLRLSLFTQRSTAVEHLRRPREFPRRCSAIRAGRPASGTRSATTSVFFAIHMLVQNPIGVAAGRAAVACRSCAARAFYRTAIFLPTMLSFVIVGFIWKLILSPLWGVAAESARRGRAEVAVRALARQGGVRADRRSSLISVWQFVGIPMMLIYAALLDIPEEVIEAAECDGITGLAQFWKIKLPLILPTIGIVSILTFVGNFNAFDLIYAVQGALAGPELRDRHPRHLPLPHLLRLPAAARRPATWARRSPR